MSVLRAIGRGLAATLGIGAAAAPVAAAPAAPLPQLPATLARTIGTLPATDQLEFLGMYGAGLGAHAGATLTRALADWQVYLGDPNDEWRYDHDALASRAWDLIRNDPHARAMVATVVRCVYGADGLVFRSRYRTDESPDTDDAERDLRRAINAAIARASNGHRIDAGGRLTRRDFGAQGLVSMIAGGDGFAVRVWKPGRPRAYQGQAWRIIAAERVSNPDGQPDSDRLRGGFGLDADGDPVSIWVRSTHPAAFVTGRDARPRWIEIPIFAPNGLRNVLHVAKLDDQRPGQLRGLSWFAPLLVLARNLQKTAEAFVVAKRMQACNAAVLRTDDAATLATAAASNARFGPNIVWRPGMVAVTSRDNEVVFPQWSFQGADYKDFIDSQLRGFTAAWGYPMQFVLQQLTDSNMAAAQVALDQADLTSTALQDLMIGGWERPIDDAILAEEVARGRLDFGGVEWDLAADARYLRPRRPDANKERTRNAAQKFIDLGGSYTTAFAEMGYDFEEEIPQRAQDEQLLARQGVRVGKAAAPAPAPAADPAADPAAPQERP